MEKLRTDKANKARSHKADEFALSLLPVMHQCLKLGRIKAREIIAALVEQGIKPVRGGKWNRSQLIRVKKRLYKIKREQPELYAIALSVMLEDDSGC